MCQLRIDWQSGRRTNLDHSSAIVTDKGLDILFSHSSQYFCSRKLYSEIMNVTIFSIHRMHSNSVHSAVALKASHNLSGPRTQVDNRKCYDGIKIQYTTH